MVGQEGAVVQRADQALVDRRALEGEGREVLHHRQLGGAQTIADRGGLAMGGLGPEQVGRDLHGGAVALKACGDRLVEGGGYAR
jgi:hypothetical protein